jgi:dTDP-4-dehydrorhamnose reductase
MTLVEEVYRHASRRRILLLGKNGQVGWELHRALAPLGELIALGRNANGGLTGDLNDLCTGAELIADVTAHALRQATGNPAVHGLYHLAAGGETSWHGYATFVAEWLHAQGVAIQAQPAAIEPVPTTAWPTPARRPLNSRLDTSKLESAFGLHLPHWQQGVARVLSETVQLTPGHKNTA